MLCANVPSLDKVKYPVLATPKLDGVRFLKIDGHALYRSFKPIANNYIRAFIENSFPDGVDGEICGFTGGFNEISARVRKVTGIPMFRVCIFDYIKDSLNKPYEKRMEDLASININGTKLLPWLVKSKEELEERVKLYLDSGYEGTVIRDPLGVYKCGRSTFNEGGMLRIKPRVRAEGVIIGFNERMHNENELKFDNFGRAKRSSHKENQVGTGTLGALRVRDIKTGEEFCLGTGFTEISRITLWRDREKLLGQIVSFEYQQYGTKDKPRQPSFKGIRALEDM